MISAVAAAAAAERSGSSENLNTLGVLQEINLLRESQLLIDIHVEVSEIFEACSITPFCGRHRTGEYLGPTR